MSLTTSQMEAIASTMPAKDIVAIAKEHAHKEFRDDENASHALEIFFLRQFIELLAGDRE